ncbi:CHAT domain-containing protein [Amycolatopsis tolypomycina]|uniref:CHAT domain-containing protein n=1 Tax=Amycolatopsis tolypomycina TaxID=208445 RepID=UPI0033BF736E
MDFWQDIRELRGRIERSRASGEFHSLHDDDVRALAERIARRRSENEEVACYLLGWLHHLWFQHPRFESADPVHLARAVICFASFQYPESTVPPQLRPLLPGPRAEPELQAGIIDGFMHHAMAGGDLIMVEAAILLCRSVTNGNAPAAIRIRALSDLGLACQHRYQRADGARDPEDLHIAVESARQVVNARDPRDPHLVIDLAHLAVASRMRFELLRDWADLCRAVELGETVTAKPHPRRDYMVVDLLKAYWHGHRHTGEQQFLDKAITVGERTLAVLPDDAHVAVGLGLQLGMAYRTRYEVTGDPGDLARTIEIGLGITADRADPGSSADLLEIVSLSCWDLAEHSGDQQDIRRAFEVTERTLAILPDNHDSRGLLLMYLHSGLIVEGEREPDRIIESGERVLAAGVDDDSMALAAVHLSLAHAHHKRFAARADKSDLDSWITHGQEAVAHMPSGGAQHDNEVNALMGAYLQRFELYGDPADIDRSVDAGRAALGSCALGSRPERLSRLATAHRARFLHTGLTSDLDTALELTRRALAEVPDDHPNLTMVLSNAGVVENTAYDHDRTKVRLERAIELFGRALAAPNSDAGDPDRAVIMANLAEALRTRALRTRFAEPALAGEDLLRATALCEEAMRVAPRTNPQWHELVSISSGVWFARFRLSRALRDLRNSMAAAESALEASPPSGPVRARMVSNLAYCYLDLAGIAHKECRPDDLGVLVEHWKALRGGEPAERVYGGYAIGAFAHALGEHEAAVTVLDEAVSLLPLVAPELNDWQGNESRLGNHYELAHEAVAAHLAVHDPEGAIEIAEASRGLLLRSALTATVDSAPRPSFLELRPAVAGGAGVLLNVGKRRADAVVVTATAAPVVVELPGLEEDEVVARALELLAAVHDTRPLARALHRRRVLWDTLDWLWTTVVEPITAALGPEVRRLWWVPTGLLSLFPLHAAGPASGPGCLERVVSSYVPTFRTLAQLQGRPTTPVRRRLTVALAATPGLPKLPGVVAEAEHLRKSGADERILLDLAATSDAVRAAMADVTWAHFACHAVSNLKNPATGGLYLHDGVFAAADIGGLRLPHAELAYLSACSTAGQGLQTNEAISLASVFHLVGFRHVIANLWPVDDTVAVEAAEAFYDRLKDGPAADDAAIALRGVSLYLRDRYPDRPDHWAGLVHSGV